MNEDQIAILRLVADAAHDYVRTVEIVSSPNYGNGIGFSQSTAPTRSGTMMQSYEKLKTAISHYRKAFDIK